MGVVIEFHPKYMNRLADVFLHKLKTEGDDAAQEYAARTFTAEIIQRLGPIIHNKSKGR